jgi:transposase-like protein
MAIPADELEEMIDELERALLTGEHSITYADGKSVTYRNAMDVERALLAAKQKLAELQGGSTSRTTLASFSKV